MEVLGIDSARYQRLKEIQDQAEIRSRYREEFQRLFPHIMEADNVYFSDQLIDNYYHLFVGNDGYFASLRTDLFDGDTKESWVVHHFGHTHDVADDGVEIARTLNF